jgi:hypothetical protein
MTDNTESSSTIKTFLFLFHNFVGPTLAQALAGIVKKFEICLKEGRKMVRGPGIELIASDLAFYQQ